MKFSPNPLMISALAVLAALPSHAATIAGDTGDGIIQSSTAGDTGGGVATTQGTTNGRARAGNWNAGSGFNFNAILIFQFPDLGMVANPFATATLDFNLEIKQDATPTFNADLYGIETRASNAMSPADDFWVGDGVDPTATLLQDSIMTPTTSLGVVSSADISAYLNSEYDSGAAIGNYVFFRLNRDGPTTITDEATGYVINTANENVLPTPVITYTAIPEPSSVVLLLAGMGFLGRRRR